MPTQSFSSGDKYNYCGRCGKRKYSTYGDSLTVDMICSCTLTDYGTVNPDYTHHYDFKEKIYLGKLWGIPIYVNSEKDKLELNEIFIQQFGWDLIKNTTEG